VIVSDKRSKYVQVLLITPLNRVLDKLIVVQLIKKYSAFNGAQRLITIFTRTC
jgi:hypothetical protein